MTHILPYLNFSHDPGKSADTTIAWVGKGIVYDTGGLSIKGKMAMPGMKRDCAGAAAILGRLTNFKFGAILKFKIYIFYNIRRHFKVLNFASF